MKTLLNTLVVSLITTVTAIPLEAQNLVPNPSFENTSACPTSDAQIQLATGWFRPNIATSDLLHSCSFGMGIGIPANLFGFQNANTGNAYAGFYTYVALAGNYREYISIKLTDSLILGEEYSVNFYVSRSDSSNYASIIGLYFSPDSIFANNVNALNNIPQLETASAIIDKTQWTQLSYTYIAAGGEKYINIGNFRETGSSDTVNTYDGGAIFNPDYYASYYYIDDISIVQETATGLPDYSSKNDVSIYPNPNKGILNIEVQTNDVIRYRLVNILTQESTLPVKLSNKQIDISKNPYGIYLLHIAFENQTLIKKVVLTP